MSVAIVFVLRSNPTECILLAGSKDAGMTMRYMHMLNKCDYGFNKLGGQLMPIFRFRQMWTSCLKEIIQSVQTLLATEMNLWR